jgi:CRP-like cAMP-binding protein
LIGRKQSRKTVARGRGATSSPAGLVEQAQRTENLWRQKENHVTPAINRDLVSSMPMFAGMEPEDIDRVLAPATSRRVASGDAVFEQGQNADRFFVLLSGRLRVTQLTEDGQQTVVRIVNPGDLFGIARALRRDDYPGTATAAVDSIVLQWPMSAWDGIISGFPSIAVNAMQAMGQRLQEAHARMRELSTEAVERRVAHAVLRLAGQAGKAEGKAVRIDFPISRQDIAEMTGTTLHTVSRILSGWQRAEIVEGGRQKLVIKDPHRLLMIADGREPGLL